MKQAKRIGIFGGSFNPVHNAHTNLAAAFVKKLKLDKLLIIPTAIPPHKVCDNTVDADHRLNMCRLAFEAVKKCEVCDIEIKRQGISYTADTLTQLKAIYPDSEFFLIMGADMFMSFDTWREPEKIISMAALCAVPRNEDDVSALSEKEKEYRARGAVTVILDMKKSDISSTMVRKLVFDDGSFSKYVDPKVEKYIYANYLYMNKGTVNYERFDKVLKARMGEKRYIHSINVASEAQRLAKKYGADVAKAKLAGVLHDITKETPSQEQYEIIKKCEQAWHEDTARFTLNDFLVQYPNYGLQSAVKDYPTFEDKSKHNPLSSKNKDKISVNNDRYFSYLNEFSSIKSLSIKLLMKL